MAPRLIHGAAMALGLAAWPASATETGVRLAGFFTSGVAFDTGEASSGLGVLRDGEVHVLARVDTDRGFWVGARAEIEFATPDDVIDESYVFVATPFGGFKIGGDDSAKGRYQNGVIYAPSGRVGYYDSFEIVENDAMAGVRGGGDPIGIYYDSPNLGGLRFGFSYHPDAARDGVDDDDGPGDTNEPVFAADEQFGAGAVFERIVGGVGFGVGAGWLRSESEPTAWHLGGNVSLGGFKLAAIFEDDGSDEFAVGASYAAGPWFAGGGFSRDFVGGDDDRVIGGWVGYELAPGVKAVAGFEHHDDDENRKSFGGVFVVTASF